MCFGCGLYIVCEFGLTLAISASITITGTIYLAFSAIILMEVYMVAKKVCVGRVGRFWWSNRQQSKLQSSEDTVLIYMSAPRVQIPPHHHFTLPLLL